MNKKKRSDLLIATQHLRNALRIIDDVLDDEQDCFDNLPDGLQVAERGEKMEQAIDSLTDASDYITDAIESIEEAM